MNTTLPPIKIIAIDPGMGQSGVAIYWFNKFTNIEYLSLGEVFELIARHAGIERVFFLVENSNLSKSNWHGSSARGGVGKNKAISQEIVNECRRKGVNVTELVPDGYSQVYAGEKKKLFAADTGWSGRSNKDNRAAAAMIMRHRSKIILAANQ